MHADDRPIALIGLMGSGKSAVAAALGERLATAVADLDAMIEADTGCTIAQLFEREGEPAFRRREAALLEQVLAAGARVIACGGGLVLDAGNRRLLRERCRAVWLTASPDTAAARIGSADGRPLLAGGPIRDRLATLLAERSPHYAGAAEAQVATDGRTVGEVADAVLEAVGGRSGSGGRTGGVAR